MGKRATIWMVTVEVDDNGLRVLDRVAAAVSEAKERTSSQALREGGLGLVTCTPLDNMTVKLSRELESRGWELSNSTKVLLDASVVVSVGDASDSYLREVPLFTRVDGPTDLDKRIDKMRLERDVRPRIEQRLVRAVPEGYRKQQFSAMPHDAKRAWVLRPACDVVRLFPAKWCSPQDLGSSFGDEPSVRLKEHLLSPFRQAAESLKSAADRQVDEVDRAVQLLEKADKVLAAAEPALASRALEELLDQLRYGTEEYLRTEPDGNFFVCGMNREDALLYLALTGAIDAAVPLRIAVEATRPSFAWSAALPRLSEFGPKLGDLPGIPPEGVRLDCVKIDSDHVLRLSSRESDRAVEIEGRWRKRGDPVIGPRQAARREEEAWGGPEESSTLMRLDDTYVWLSLDDAPTVEADGLATLEGTAPAVSDCLALWRSGDYGPDDTEERAKAWRASRPNASGVACRLAEGLFRLYAPWPEPFVFREESDDEWKWSSRECLAAVKPMFGEIARAPIRQEPPSLVANFLYLIQSPRMICHAWPAEVKDSWRFKLRTQDHTWIAGLVWRDLLEAPSTSEQGVPARFEPASSYGTSEVVVSVGNLRCEISEKSR